MGMLRLTRDNQRVEVRGFLTGKLPKKVTLKVGAKDASLGAFQLNAAVTILLKIGLATSLCLLPFIPTIGHDRSTMIAAILLTLHRARNGRTRDMPSLMIRTDSNACWIP